MANDTTSGQTSFWLQVFSNSKVNGALYLGDHLPSYGWAWPTDTYMQRRLRLIRLNALESTDSSCGDADLSSNGIDCAAGRLELAHAETLH